MAAAAIDLRCLRMITFVRWDITRAEVDAVVNAATEWMLGGDDGAAREREWPLDEIRFVVFPEHVERALREALRRSHAERT